LNVDTLIAHIRDQRSTLLPFVGSGMTVPAGAPTVPDLARTLAHRTGVPLDADEWPDLPKIVDAAEEAHGSEDVRQVLSEITTGWILHPTPALTALCGTPTRTIITTNYDDGIERAAHDRGLLPTPLLPTDPKILLPPAAGELHVVHLHGIAGCPETLVLPGRTTDALKDDQVFQAFISTILAPRGVVHFGFSFAREETHLHKILAWLQEHVADTGRHFVLLPKDEIAKSTHLDAYNLVTVVPYVKDGPRTQVERVCVAFAPRTGRRDDQHDAVTWVHPVIFAVGPEDDAERLTQRLAAFDFGTSSREEHLSYEALGAERPALLIGAPGAGKTTTLERLAGLDDRPTALGSLAAFKSSRGDDPPERAVTELLLDDDGQRVAVDVLDGSPRRFCLDRLDEVAAGDRDAALEAIAAAVSRWPQHAWIVASRPTTVETALRELGFAVCRMMPSRRWAQRYLETRGVPPYRTRQALLDGYGLGELMRIPVFAERVADRLLDEDPGVLRPLSLLTETQDEATAREARRFGENAADLGGFLGDLAVALAARGLSSAPVAELGDLPTPPGVTRIAARERLVEASVLADEPGVAAFPHKTLQDALCARAILATGDPAGTLRRIATVEIDGQVRFRDDWDFLIDLVFEHVDRADRAALRELDEQRWARTAVTDADVDEAREAFGALWEWHAERAWPLGIAGDGGLRTAHAAVLEIARRWPVVIEERREELERALVEDDGSAQRAIVALAGLPEGGATTAWIAVCLCEDRPLVADDAAAAAMRLGITGVVPRLRELANSDNERVSDAAVGALVQLVPVAELPPIVRALKPYDRLRASYRLLCERLDLDTGLAVVQAAGQLTPTTAAVLDHLVREVSDLAWTPDRVEALVRVLAPGGQDVVDLAGIVKAVGHQPRRAFETAATFVQPFESRRLGPSTVMRVLGCLTVDLPPTPEFDALRSAIANTREEDGQRRDRDEAPRRAREQLAAQIDRSGLALEPDALRGVGQLRQLDEHHREFLAKLVDRWWPDDGLSAFRGSSSESVVAERARAAIRIGAELEVPLTDTRWAQLLDAHLGPDGWTEPLRWEATEVTRWLAHSWPYGAHTILAARIAGAHDAEVLSQLLGVAGPGHATPRLVDAALARLTELDSSARWWLNAAGFIVELGEIEQVRLLLELALAPIAREHLIDRLARAGDAEAQREVLDRLAIDLLDGKAFERPHWWEEVRRQVPVDATAHLADVALQRGDREAAHFAISLLEHRMDPATLPALNNLVAQHGRRHLSLGEALVRHGRRLASVQLIAAAPTELGSAAAWFHGQLDAPSAPVA
jgi:hypothetical protein